MPISFKTEETDQLNSCSEVYSSFRENRCIIIVQIIFALILVGLILFFIVQIGEGKAELSRRNFVFYITIISLATLPLVLVFLSSLVIRTLLKKTRLRVKEIVMEPKGKG